MVATTQQGEATVSETTPILNPEQMKQILASLSGGPRKPKAKEVEV